MQRLLEGELRAASITASEVSTRGSTHASNFSLRMRSAALADTATVSIPNWRKHSLSNEREDSFKSTRAVRAEAFRREVPGKITGAENAGTAKAFSMSRGRLSNW